MSRTIVTETEVYTYAELSEEAKERAQAHYNDFLWRDGEMHERMEDIADGFLTDAGFEESTDLEYSLYSQGGFPRFTTNSASSMEFNGRQYHVQVHVRDGVYAEDVTDDEEGEYGDYDTATIEHFQTIVDDLSDKIFWAMREEDEYMSSDEQVSEASEANGWEYDVDGNLA